jgi:hypothetical protein
MVYQKRLINVDPEEQTKEITEFLSQKELNPENLLYRIFNSQQILSVLKNGTDRIGKIKKKENFVKYASMNKKQNLSNQTTYEKMGASSWDEMMGYDRELIKRGLIMADGIWLCNFTSLQKTLTPGYVVVPNNIGIAVYDPLKMEEINLEFYTFKEPFKKLEALIAVISDNLI